MQVWPGDIFSPGWGIVKPQGFVTVWGPYDHGPLFKPKKTPYKPSASTFINGKILIGNYGV